MDSRGILRGGDSRLSSATLVTGIVGMVGAGITNLVVIQEGASPLLLIPAINLTAVILGSIAMGAMFNRVRQLEKRLDEMREDEVGAERRRRPARKARS